LKQAFQRVRREEGIHARGLPQSECVREVNYSELPSVTITRLGRSKLSCNRFSIWRGEVCKLENLPDWTTKHDDRELCDVLSYLNPFRRSIVGEWPKRQRTNAYVNFFDGRVNGRPADDPVEGWYSGVDSRRIVQTLI
jgi:hypothetical protein